MQLVGVGRYGEIPIPRFDVTGQSSPRERVFGEVVLTFSEGGMRVKAGT
jgi:hypothetical protein